MRRPFLVTKPCRGHVGLLCFLQRAKRQDSLIVPVSPWPSVIVEPQREGLPCLSSDVTTVSKEPEEVGLRMQHRGLTFDEVVGRCFPLEDANLAQTLLGDGMVVKTKHTYRSGVVRLQSDVVAVEYQRDQIALAAYRARRLWAELRHATRQAPVVRCGIWHGH